MKKIHIISKTHLDLGFTDYAAEIEKLYLDDFFPRAAALAEELNTVKKRFVWTTGSWIIEKALHDSSSENKKTLERALEKGDIVPHALPFTTHTELLDEDTFCYGLEIGQKLKARFGFNMIAAKMTDVPGHTKTMLPLLNRYGIKFLHIGVNDSSAIPEVPQAFLWKFGDAELVVLYEGSYGSLYKNEHIDDILYFAHSSDNRGPNSKQSMLDTFAKLEKEYPDYVVEASTLDNYAAELLKVKDKLPIITSEIGDSWIHGAASDPYKSGAIRELIALKNTWLAEGSLEGGGAEHVALRNSLLTLCEHTWGMDVKRHLSDIGLYLKKHFKKARKTDKPRLYSLNKSVLRWQLITAKKRREGEYNKGSYSVIEKSWQEQRDYITKALENMSEEHRQQAESRLRKLMPQGPFEKDGWRHVKDSASMKSNGFELSLNAFGGIRNLSINDATVFEENNSPLIDYCSYGAKDYDFWLKNYSRGVGIHNFWVIPDFARPALDAFEGQYPQGAFPYKLSAVYTNEDMSQLIACLYIDVKISEELGAPRNMEIKYSVENKKLIAEIIFTDKDASRLTEALWAHICANIDKGSLRYKKFGQLIDPYDVVRNGNRNLAAVESVQFDINGNTYEIKNCHAPLVALGKGKILRFDNEYADISEGISFCLHNNVWGTNFPLWYENNAYFRFELSMLKKEGADD